MLRPLVSPARLLGKVAVVVAVVVAVGGASSACGNPACKIGGINDPSNRTLRRDLLHHGLGEFCKEMLSREAPLKLAPDTPVTGRFFPTRCNQREVDGGNLVIDFEGSGYVWTALSKKATFTAAGTVEYDQDFRCSEDDAMYAYFPVKQVRASSFQMRVVEAPLAQMMQPWIQQNADNFGSQLLGGKLHDGFTVIRDSSGGTDFDIGILPLGQRPQHPFRIANGSRMTYENARTEVHQNERDFIGPIRLDKSGAIFLTANVDGIDAVDVFVIPKDEGDASLKLFLDYGPSGKLAFEPQRQWVVQRAQDFRQTVTLPAGMYYVVIDNTPWAGQVAPPQNALDDRAAVVSYAIQIGDAP